MKRLRRFFLSRLLREKLLLVALLGLAVAIWGSGAVRRLGETVSEHRRASADLGEQALWLGQRATIEAAAKAAVEHLDPARSFNAVRLNAELAAIATATGITKDVQTDSARTERINEFAVHTVQFTARRADYGALQRFYFELGKRAPYIGIEQFSISADRANPAQLNASIRVTSVELSR